MVDSLDSYFSRLRVSRLPGRSPAHILDQSPYAFPLKRAITWADILYTIYSTGLPGPAITAGDKQYIGTGAQFVVYGQDMEIAPESKSIPVAIKQPKFNLDARKRLDLEDPETRKHLHSIQLEIKALTRPELRSHRNIPTLLAWTYDVTDFRHSISLVQELAISNMELLLSTRGEQISVSQKSSFCYDIAAALDAIHDCGFSHGDVKPSNVLIFPGKDGFVAKLADFGLSIVETQGEDTKFNIGGTLGWQAPEVQDGMLLGPDGLIKADNYSFGLVAWSTVLGSGRTPPRHSGKDREEWIIRELESAKESDDYATFVALESMVRVVLRADPTQRPFKLLEPMNTNIIQNQISHFRMTDDDELSKIVAPLNPQLQPDFYWELPTLPDFFIRDLIPHCLENPDILDPPMHFSLFLRLTQKDPTKDRENSLKALLNAAEGGFPPAQALVPLVFASYGLPIPPQIHQRVDGWLISAISTGSVVAREYLEKSHSAATLAALQKFRDYGGYSALYLDLPSLSGLHAAAAYRTKDDIKSMLDMDSSLNIEDGTADGARPLYIACARGSWDIAVELLGRGADASVRCTKYGITCLHWLFAFEASLQCTVAASLVKAGADVNAIITESVSFYHFPFYLPAGSPLHWAVVTRSEGAVEALLQHGADPTIRDISDPYKYDRRISMINNFGGPHQDIYSDYIVGMGLSSLDYAALYHEPWIFEYLRRTLIIIDINVSDDEGLTVFHRLSSHHIHYTKRVAYSFRSFQGSSTFLRSRLARTIDAIKALGGDIDKFTTPLTPFVSTKDGWQFEGFTPLMMAALDGNYVVVQALVAGGADVNKETTNGNTALHMYSSKFRAETCAWDNDVTKILLEAGATINHKNKQGQTPLGLAAMSYGGLERVELFLQYGADIGDTDGNPLSAKYGLGVFSLLARVDPPFDESWDLKVASLLERFVFNYPDAKKRDSVIAHVNENGETIMHRFAAAHMRHSINALLRYGAPALVFARRHAIRGSMGERVHVTWLETPLDRAVETKEDYERNIRKHMKHSLTEFQDICSRDNAVTSALEAAGCQRSTKQLVSIGSEPPGGLRPWVIY